MRIPWHAIPRLPSLLLAMVLLPHIAPAKITLPACFSDHMVLQRDIPLPVWGKAASGDEITVEFAGQKKTATVAADGNWMITLDALKADADPGEISISSKKSPADNKLIADVLVGDVWLGSGQSNMGLTVQASAPLDERLAALATGTYPRLRFLNTKRDGWQLASPQNIESMSALLFSFGVSLQKDIEVPIGLIVSAVGSTASGFWISEQAYRDDAACREAVKKFAPTYPLADLQQQYAEKLKAWTQAEAEAKAQNQRLPKKPLPPGQPGETASAPIGHLFETRIRPIIPYAIRGVLWDQGESGTGIVGVDQYSLMGALISSWRREWKQGDFPFLYMQKPSGGGPAWDGSNPSTAKAAKFTPLQPGTPVPDGGSYRENHIKIGSYPHTFMVTSSDMGSGTHPADKSSYGERAALVALGTVYGKSLEYSGPVFASCQIESGKARIHFTHVGKGLAFRPGEKLQGFLIAGDDRKFVWAEALIEGDTVVVSSPAVPNPAAVRYGWAKSVPWANLFNKDGLPAQAFRTDQWEENAPIRNEEDE